MRPRSRHPGTERSRGQVLAEFTLVIPLLLAIVLGIAEGGYFVAATTMVNSATHEGARFGVLEDTESLTILSQRVASAAAPIVSIAEDEVTLELAKSNGDGTWAAATDCDDTCYGERQKDDLLIVHTAYEHRPLVGSIFPDFRIPSGATAELTVEGDAA